MAKKRKSEATRLDEVDRSMYTSFCSAANSLSQLYTQSMNQQRLSFQAGERHGLDKLYQWIFRQQQEGSRVNAADVVAYLQNELEYGIDESPMSPRVPFQPQQNPQAAMHLANPVFPSPSFGPTAAAGQGPPRSGHPDHHQTKNSVFSNALSSPVRRSLQQYHLSEGDSYPPAPHNRDNNNPSSNDSAMDMHSDSPGRDSS